MLSVHSHHTIRSTDASVKEDVLVLRVGNLISALQPPHCFPHMLGLKWGCISPLLTNVQCCKDRNRLFILKVQIRNDLLMRKLIWSKRNTLFCKPATHLPRQFLQQKPWKYQTWQSPHSETLMILLWTGSTRNKKYE